MNIFKYKNGKSTISVMPEKVVKPKSKTSLWMIAKQTGKRLSEMYGWRFNTFHEAQEWLDEEADEKGWRFDSAIEMPDWWNSITDSGGV